MPVYHVQAPDGSVLHIEGPADPQPGEIEHAAEQHFNVQKQTAADRKTFTPVTDNIGETFRAGMGRAVDKGLDSLTQLYLGARGEHAAEAGHEQNIAEKRRLDQPLADSTAGHLGEIGGDIAMTAVPGAKVVKGFQAGAKAIPVLAKTIPKLSRYVAGVAGAAAGGGGAAALMQPTVGDETRADNAIEGAEGGAFGQGVLGPVLGSTVNGVVKLSKHAAKLAPGVRDASTLGQIADRSTYMGQLVSGMEEKLKSFPLVGAAIKNARGRGVDAWRNQVLDDVSPQGFQRTGEGTTRDAVGEIADEFHTRYKGALQGQTIDPAGRGVRAYQSRAGTVIQSPRNGLLPDQKDQIGRQVSDYFDDIFGVNQGLVPGIPTRKITADQAKEFERFLTAQGRQARMSNAPNSQNIAEVYDNLENAWTSGYRSQLPLATRQAIKPLDARYAPFKTAEKAATYVGNDEGAFTPAQLLTAVKARTRGPQFARGGGMLQQKAQTGKSTYQDHIPNSGTTDRALAAGLLTGLFLDPITAATTIGGAFVGAVPALTSKTGKNLLTGGTKVQRFIKALREDPNTPDMVSGVPLGAIYSQD